MKQIFDFYQYSQEINHLNEMSSELAGIDKLGEQHPMSKAEEIKNNPRSRSAKLRILEKI